MPGSLANHNRNIELAREINREARRNPASPYADKYVGIAQGKVIVVSKSLEEVLAALNEVAADRDDGLVMETSADYEGPHEIWSKRGRGSSLVTFLNDGVAKGDATPVETHECLTAFNLTMDVRNSIHGLEVSPFS